MLHVDYTSHVHHVQTKCVGWCTGKVSGIGSGNECFYVCRCLKHTPVFSYSTISGVMCTLEILRAPFTPELGVQFIFTVKFSTCMTRDVWLS